jgi:hypothetical protein
MKIRSRPKSFRQRRDQMDQIQPIRDSIRDGYFPRLLELQPEILVNIAEYSDPWDVAVMDHVLRKNSDWLNIIFPKIEFEFMDHRSFPAYVLSWCLKRDAKITHLDLDYSTNGEMSIWPSFVEYLTRGGNSSLIELWINDQPPGWFLHLVTTLCDSNLKLSSLKKLYLGGVNAPHTLEYPVDVTIQLIHRCCPELTELQVSGKTDTNLLLYSIIECPKLFHLNLPGCTRHLDDGGLQALLPSLVGKRLLSLDISHWTFRDGRVFDAISKNCSQLQYLNLSRTEFSYDDNGLILSIAKGCRHLKRLNLDHCYWLKDESFRALSRDRESRTSGEHQLLVELEDLSMIRCLGVRGSTIPSFSTLFPKVKRLNLRGIIISYEEIEEFLMQLSSANRGCCIELTITTYARESVSKEGILELISNYPNANVILMS